jgi:2'-5' RNA ligase
MRETRKGILLNCRNGVNAQQPGSNLLLFLCIVSRRIVIAYWLIPVEPARGFFQDIVDSLASRHHAPVFEPHVTVHVGADRLDTAEKTLSKAARECQRIKLKPLGIGHSDDFIKTLFVQFALSAKLRRLNETIRKAAQDSSRYELKPHLSLLYKTMPALARRELANSINVPFAEVTFDGLKAVRCVSPTQSRANVEAWQVVATKELSE